MGAHRAIPRSTSHPRLKPCYSRHSWLLQTTDAQDAVVGAVNSGGATHLVGGLTGALVGAAYGIDAFPARWRAQLERREELLGLATPSHQRSTGKGPTCHADPASIWFLLDRSGSMQPLADAVVDSFREFLAEQHETAQAATLTLVQFDNPDSHEVIIDRVPLREVRPLTREQFQPRGTTPLYDAIGLLIERVDRHVMTGGDDADQLVVIFTDGYENASTRWTQREIFDLIDNRTRRGWTFAFLGAHQDSMATGRGISVAAGNTADWVADAAGTRAAWRTLGRSARDYETRSRALRRAHAGRFLR